MPKRHSPNLPERQVVRVPFSIAAATEVRTEYRDGSDLQALSVEGLASTYGYEYEVYGGPSNGAGWVERIAKGAFTETLSEDPDVVLLLNHEGMPLARTKSGTLELKEEKAGLGVRADLDLANPLVQTLASSLNRGDVDEMSFAFRVTQQTWEAHDDFPDDEMSLRTISSVNLHRGDVSAVTYGASDATEIDIVRSLDHLSADELVEARAAIDRRLKKQDPDGMSGNEDGGGMPPHLLELLRIQPLSTGATP